MATVVPSSLKLILDKEGTLSKHSNATDLASSILHRIFELLFVNLINIKP